MLSTRLPRLLRWPWLVALSIFLVLGLWQIRPLDDVRAMQIPDAELREREQRFQAATGQQMALQYLLVSAPQTEQLLQSLESLQSDLDALVAKQVIGGYRNLAQWLPSQQQQDRNRQVWQQTFLSSGALEQLLDRLDVVPETKTQLLQGYGQQGNYLPVDDTLALLNALPDAPLVFQQDEQWHAVVLLEKLTDTAALAALAENPPQLLWVDIVGQTNQLLQQYRQGTVTLLLLAYAVIGLLFSWRYGLRGSLAILLPPLLSSLITLALAGWFGWPVSVFNMMALLLVLGIGIDAALFMRESGGKHYYTLVAIGISTVTTLLSFGLLSLSATAAIHSFGVTILIGISFCFILAPLAALSPRHDPGEQKA
jgi:predicted exporter